MAQSGAASASSMLGNRRWGLIKRGCSLYPSVRLFLLITAKAGHVQLTIRIQGEMREAGNWPEPSARLISGQTPSQRRC